MFGQDQALILFLAEHHGFTVFKVQIIIIAFAAITLSMPGVLIEDDAVLEHLDKGHTLVLSSREECISHVLLHHVDSASDEGRLRRQSHGNGVEGLFEGAHGRGLAAESLR